MNKIFHKDFESAGDFVLPDYLGDVRKVVYSSAKAIPSGKFVGDGEVHLSGIVAYDVLYCDGENKLTRFESTSDYDIAVPVDKEEYYDCLPELRVTNFTIRPTGPRKLSAKSVLSLALKITGSDNPICKGSAFEDGRSPEKLIKTISSENVIFGSTGEREYAELAERVMATAAENIEIITSSGAVRISESTPVDGGINVKGEIIVTAIVKTDEQPPFAIKKTIPFDETVTIENMPQEVQTYADGYLTSVNAFVADDEEGCAVTVNAIAEFYAVSACNSDVSVVCDAYLEDYETEGAYSDFDYTSLLCMGVDDSAFSLECDRSAVSIENIRDILFISCDLRKIEKKICRGHLEISGDACFSGVACEINDDSTLSYAPLKFTLPFSYNVNNDCQISENTIAECTPEPVFVDYILDSGKIVLKCGVKTKYRIYDKCKVKIMTECNSTAEIDKTVGCSVITVYYPEECESIFEVAKKYHTTVAKIAETNNLADSVFKDCTDASSAVSRLIIR